MLRKMILQAVVAAVLIGGAAAVYAQVGPAPQVAAGDHDGDHSDRDDD